jgi:RNA-directed DNA polymerase
VLSPMGLRLSEEKTTVVHIDEGFDLSRLSASSGRPKPGSNKRVRLHLAVEEGIGLDHGQGEGDHETGNEQIRSPTSCANSTGALRGWTTYFRHGVSKATFGYLGRAP